ncbi:MAG: hypothetical protein JKY37_02450 [Nannocystaceae bacterium]|nr:hypothetical protein [Nannocystaceae bacterium]
MKTWWVEGCGPVLIAALATLGCNSYVGATHGADTTGTSSGGESSESSESSGEEVDPREGVVAGSGLRLRARYLVAPGGGQHLLGFWDTELEIECEFYETATAGIAVCPASRPT